MPSSNSICETLEFARGMAKELADGYADDDSDDEFDAVAAGGPDLFTIEIENASETHLRTYVEVTECDDEGCCDTEGDSSVWPE